MLRKELPAHATTQGTVKTAGGLKQAGRTRTNRRRENSGRGGGEEGAELLCDGRRGSGGGMKGLWRRTV